MHRDCSYKEMTRLINTHLDINARLRVLDVGSWSNTGPEGSIRSLMSPNWEYIGVDVRGSKKNNVDIRMPAKYHIPFPANTFDAVFSMACFEHVHNPFKLMWEVSRVMKPGATLIMTAPFIYPVHDRFDGWRFLPKGMRVLLNESGLDRIDSYLRHYDVEADEYNESKANRKASRYVDCWTIGKKP